MEMPEAARWRRAMIFSAILHCMMLLCTGYFMLRELLPPQEEVLEIALVNDFLPGAGGGGGGAPGLADIKIPQVSAPKSKAIAPSKSAEQMPRPSDAFTENKAEEKPAVSRHDSLGTSQTGSENGVMEGGGIGGESGSGEGLGSGAGAGTGTGTGSGSGNGNGESDGSGAAAISPPGILARVKPSYPNAARRNGVEGTVYLRVRITEDGSASDVSVDVSSGDASLDSAAAQAIYKWRFIPAKDGAGRSISCYTQIPVTFRLTDA